MSLRFASKTVIFSFTVVSAFVFSFVLLLPTAGVAGKGQVKEEVCHITGTHDFDDGYGEVPVGHIISVSVSAYQAHIDHGDPEYWNSKTIADGSELCFPGEPGAIGTAVVHKSPWSINHNSATQMYVKFETDTGVDFDHDHIFIDLNPTTDCNNGDTHDCLFEYNKLVKNIANDTRLWTFTCDRLTPNTDYNYKICFRGWVGYPWQNRTGFFRTPPHKADGETVISPRLQFFAYGDSRGGGTYTDKISGLIASYQKNYRAGDFIIHTGDIVLSGGDVCHWDSDAPNGLFSCPWNDNFWIWPGVQAMLSRMPIFTTIGNHDFFSSDGPTASFYDNYFPYLYPHQPANSQDLEHLYYSFDWGPAKFWSLTNYPMTSLCGTPTSMQPGTDQMVWFEDEVTENNGAWKIVYMHVAAYSCACVLSNKNDLVTLFQDHGVDMVLQGHNHYYARKTVAGIPYLTLGGGGATLEDDVDYAGCREGDGSAAEKKYHFGYFEIDHDYLVFQARDENGGIFDEVLLDRHPKLDFSVTAGESDYKVELEHNITGHFVPDTCYWHFNDGTPSVSCDDTSTEHYFTAAGSYEITLTACSAFDGCSKYTRTIDVPVADDAHKAPACTPAWSYYPNSIPGDWDNASQGAGIAVKDINGNGQPELFVFSINNTGDTQDNTASYRIGWNLNYEGIPSTWSDRINIPNWSGFVQQGGGLAVEEVEPGVTNLFAFGINDPVGINNAYYSVGFNLNSDGIARPDLWQKQYLPAWVGDEQEGGGFALADINKDGWFEMIAFGINNPGGINNAFYQIGWGLDPSNSLSNTWSNRINIPTWGGDIQQGGGITIADIDKNGLLDLIAFGIMDPVGRNTGFYTIGWNINPENMLGYTADWSDPIGFPGRFGNENHGGGITVADLNNNGYPELIVFSIDEQSHGNYLVGWDLQSDGKATSICLPSYEIGDTGPAGGCVSYVYDDGKHGMEAAPYDQSNLVELGWGCAGTETGADGVAVGTGKRNTVDILAACTEDGIAAQIADNYSLNGYTDWFLPSFNELLDIRKMSFINKCNFYTGPDDDYWSSSESNPSDAWLLPGDTGYPTQAGKSACCYRVRAVREF